MTTSPFVPADMPTFLSLVVPGPTTVTPLVHFLVPFPVVGVTFLISLLALCNRTGRVGHGSAMYILQDGTCLVIAMPS